MQAIIRGGLASTIRVDRRLKSADAIDVLSILRGVPSYVRSDNGPEFIAKAVREWITAAPHALLRPAELRTSTMAAKPTMH
jgi:hypothetical protein